MPLHCAAIRPNFFNVSFFLFQTLWPVLTTFLRVENNNFNEFFVLPHLLSSTLVSTSFVLSGWPTAVHSFLWNAQSETVWFRW